jgi:DNA-directed RNA polymerase specialized sigma24 family protein
MRGVPADAELPSLVASARRGDQPAWDALVARFTPLLWAIARGHGLPAAAAADVAHTTWLRFVESLDVAPDDAVGEWVAALARAESVQALRWVDPRPDRRSGPPDEIWAAVELLPARCRLTLRVLAVTPPPDEHELAAVLDLAPADAKAFAAECLERLSMALSSTTTT